MSVSRICLAALAVLTLAAWERPNGAVQPPASARGCPDELSLVCGSDGRTYRNACVSGRAGVRIVPLGNCRPEVRRCGGVAGLSCPEGQTCDMGRGPAMPDQMGVCRAPPRACSRHLAPVCGSDGRTHANSCVAENTGAMVVHRGACRTR